MRSLTPPRRHPAAGLVAAGSAKRPNLPALGTLVLVLAAGLAGCGGSTGEQPPSRTASEVLQESSDSLFAIRGVRGTGVTDWREEEVIVVIVDDRRTADLSRIPERLEGHRVLVLDEEEIRRWGGL